MKVRSAILAVKQPIESVFFSVLRWKSSTMPRKPSRLETIHEAEIGVRIAIGVRQAGDKWTVPPKDSPDSALLALDSKKLWRELQDHVVQRNAQFPQRGYPPVPHIVMGLHRSDAVHGQSASMTGSLATAKQPSLMLRLVSQPELEDWGRFLFWLEVRSWKDLKAAAKEVDKDNSETERNTDGNGSETEFEDLSEIEDEPEYTGGTGSSSSKESRAGWI